VGQNENHPSDYPGRQPCLSRTLTFKAADGDEWISVTQTTGTDSTKTDPSTGNPMPQIQVSISHVGPGSSSDEVSPVDTATLDSDTGIITLNCNHVNEDDKGHYVDNTAYTVTVDLSPILSQMITDVQLSGNNVQVKYWKGDWTNKITCTTQCPSSGGGGSYFAMPSGMTIPEMPDVPMEFTNAEPDAVAHDSPASPQQAEYADGTIGGRKASLWLARQLLSRRKDPLYVQGKTVEEWAAELGKKPDVLYDRIRRGLPVSEVLS
jgi:hypothetical protein